MQVKDLIVTGDAKILGNLYANGGSVSGSGGSGSSDGSGLTYKLTKSGSTITLTGSDGSTSSVTDANTDTNTTYSAGTGISLSGTTFSNSGVRSIATGSSNGTISVNTNGSTANVAVKGLGSAAYTASTAYATSSHTHDDRYFTESEINSKLGGYSPTSHTHNDLKPFVATYGSTKFSDILAAHNAGRIVIMTSLNTSSYLASSILSATVVGNVSSNSANFYVVVLLTNGCVTRITNTVTSSDVWGNTCSSTPSLNRTTNLNASDTNYTTLMARGTSLNSSTTNPAVNGAIAWTYA